MSNQPTADGMWQLQLQNKFTPLSSTETSPSSGSKSRSNPEHSSPEHSKPSVGSTPISNPKQSKPTQGCAPVGDPIVTKKSLRIANLNINRGLFWKEDWLKYDLQEYNIDIIGVSEVDLIDFDEKKHYKIEGFNTFFTLQRPGSNKKRLLCFVKDDLEVTQRSDLMSNSLSSVWLEMKTRSQKILICTIYREWDNLDGNGKLDTDEQINQLHTLKSQIGIASKEGLVIVLGDMNIDLNKWEISKLSKLSEEYQLLIGECGLELMNYGITYSRIIESVLRESALDHALTNKPEAIEDYFKVKINYSDHHLICVDVKCNV